MIDEKLVTDLIEWWADERNAFSGQPPRCLSCKVVDHGFGSAVNDDHADWCLHERARSALAEMVRPQGTPRAVEVTSD